MAIALLSGPQDPSQLDAVINSLINSINGYVGGTTALTAGITPGTTSADLAAFGTVTLTSTSATASYLLSPPALGQTVTIVATLSSTGNQTVAIDSTSVTYNTTGTANLLFTTAGQSVTLQRISATKIAVISNVGTVTSS